MSQKERISLLKLTFLCVFFSLFWVSFQMCFLLFHSKWLKKRSHTLQPWFRLFTPGKSYWTGRISTVDLLVLTCLNLHFLNWKYYLPFFSKQAALMRRPTVLSFPSTLVVSVQTQNQWHGCRAQNPLPRKVWNKLSNLANYVITRFNYKMASRY